MMRIGTTLIAITLLVPVSAASQASPTPVSPGGTTVAIPITAACPTFSWGGAGEADAYELALYRVTRDGSLDPLFQTRVAAGARSWTPPAADFRSRGPNLLGRYDRCRSVSPGGGPS